MYLYFFFSYFSSPSIYHSERLERSWKINRILCVCFHLLLTHIFQCRCHSTGIRKNYSIITALLQRIAGAVVSLRYTHTTHNTHQIYYSDRMQCLTIYILSCFGFGCWSVTIDPTPIHTHTHTYGMAYEVCGATMEWRWKRSVVFGCLQA